MIDVWMGVNGAYEVPSAISNLGKLANKNAGLPWYDPSNYKAFEWFSKSPYYKIVAEWGTWRDGN